MGVNPLASLLVSLGSAFCFLGA